jgi:hypothetical protein
MLLHKHNKLNISTTPDLTQKEHKDNHGTENEKNDYNKKEHHTENMITTKKNTILSITRIRALATRNKAH